ncbi:hypothetical protein R6Q59_028449 [Mikania micrantha]
MAIAELFIGALITVLFEKLASADLIKLARSAGIHSELNKVRENLLQIEAVLVDAAQRHITQTSVELWLKKLQHLAYEIEDVLDDLATEATRRRLNKESYASTSTSKITKFIPNKFNAFKYGHQMGSKIDGITTKLRNLVEEIPILRLIDNVERQNYRRPEETSLVEESEIIGREDDKEALLGKLLGGESSSRQNFNVLSIVGLGGIGKTTLCQLLYNDEKVKSHFELMSWFCVSDEFDVFSISKAIFKDVSGEDRRFETLNQLQVALKEKLSKKRFLIVLDDVWNEDYNKWELLQRPFTVGAPGSKILVTTRKKKVELVMDSVQSCPLELLSEEESLSLFAQHASGKQNFDVNEKLKIHGEDIVKKCGQLPLALRTLGRVFRTKLNVEEWEELLNSEIWNLDNQSEILPALKLSYYDLPPHLKQMFAYCSLFPKDYMFDMAEGYLYESNGNKSMESFGREGFEELVSRSFFQHSSNDKSIYIMHDLINDLARSVAREFFLMLDNKMDISDENANLEKCHHISFIYNELFEGQRKFKELQRARLLRTFLVVPFSSWNTYFRSHEVLTEIIPKLEFLRVLNLTGNNITEVPSSICSLKHLRYINLSNSNITCLPEDIGDLVNLQSLLLSGCSYLSSLPTSISTLINLRHLDISSTPKLKKMSLGIGGLTRLQTLSKVIIGEDDDDFKLSYLKGLLNIQGHLLIEGLHKVRNAVEAMDAKLHQKKGIFDLQLEWSDFFDGSRDEKNEYEVLDWLRPFEKLRRLRIEYYMGKEFPSWVGHSSFELLNQLTLRGCKNCKYLPALGLLLSLQNLCVEGMDGLERLGFEFLGHANSCDVVAFPSLEVLKFIDMKSWVEWSTCGGDTVGAFPCLREIYIINCPKLDVVTVELTALSLQVLHVQGCSLAMLRSMVGMCSSIARLTVHNIKCLKAVEDLEISCCDELTSLWESNAVTRETFLNLQKLKVNECKQLLSLGEEELQSVKEVEIDSCERLESYKCPSSIEKLEIRFCRSLTSLSFPTMEGVPSTLKSLYISGCDNEEVSWLVNNFLSSIEHFEIQFMPNLRFFPEGCFVHLTSLVISDCHSIESIPGNGYGFLPSRCLRYLHISNCKNLKSFPHEHLNSLASLKEMKINECPNLDYPIPGGLWPPNLRSLRIGTLKKPISEWGKQNFPTSLVELTLIDGINPGVVTFAKADEESSSSFILPQSLTSLTLFGFMELESLSEGLQHLTSLQHLYILWCPKLRDLPETLLPSTTRKKM